MTTVIDQARPWLTPSSTLAATIQPQLGATRDQQRDRQRHGPAGDQQPPATGALRERAGAEVGQRLGEPEGDDERQHRRAGGQVEVLAADQRQRRALEPDHRADEGVDRDQQRELRGVLAQPEPDRAAVTRPAASGRPMRLAATIAAWCSGAGGMSAHQRLDEGVLGVEPQRRVVAALEADRRDRVGRQAAAADRPGVVRGVEHEVVGQREQPLGQRPVQRCAPSPRRCASPWACRSGRPASPTSSASPVSTSHGSSPRRVVGDQVGVVRERVARGRDRLDLGVAELDDLAVARARDARSRPRRPRAGTRCAPVRSTSSGSPETWSACTCVSNTATIGSALALGQRDVLVDEVDVRVDDRELRCASCTRTGRRRRPSRRSAAVGSTRRTSDRFTHSDLTSYQVIY